MKSKATFYHAGCPVCVEAERTVACALDTHKYEVEIVHLGTSKERVSEAEGAGVKSVPALVVEGKPFHINFGASLTDLQEK
jgi:glutaredoxin